MTLGSTKSTTRLKEGIVGVGSNSRSGCDGSKLDGSKFDGSEVDDSKVDDSKVDDNEVDDNEVDDGEVDDGEVDSGKVDNEIGKKGQKTSKSKKLFKSKKTLRSDFLTSKAKLAFTKLRQAFVKAPILYHFNPKYYIWVEKDISGYAIGRVLRQLTLDDSG